ncbi:MAG: prenyltransferase/squalene oxidase repeat-containing protein [Propionicimonas sp.]|uniref:prenyltransferase/squalene oxidase repeat-containing protein n=1 Tax=Propionicimonas sp. TaxID=1955623 RepID=UPI002B21C6EE|nr:prenyltransferase/squalene oxidase repeat-containing protein [Propionicimonas sp.]MEA4943272.1 prenyltransferase/squalene oxidase repeat-containing protein [Propionicimonas sp.]MEA5117068.1 prenyltransferase/squalene oxidase repeat-containing protein [Propionicimonas sp.]
MNHHRLLLATTAATATLLISAPLAVAAPDTTGAQAAAGYLTSQLVDGSHLTSEFGDQSITADAVLALVAAGRAEDKPAIEAMTGYLEQTAATYTATGPEAAAKLTLVTLATGADPAAFGGQDLPAQIKDGVAADGSFGAFPGPYASGLAMVALTRAGQEIPQPMVDWLLSGAAEGGGWGYDPSQPADADSTGMALLGLAAVPSPGDQVTAAIDAGTAWAVANRSADGSWPGFAPVNSTATLGSALVALGTDQPESVAYLLSQQQPDGGLATGADGATGADLLATAQGTLLLAGASYLDLAPAATAALAPGMEIPLWSLVGLIGLAIVAVVVVEYRRL